MKTEDELRQAHRKTPAGRLLARVGLDYWDTESCARRVAEHAAGEIAELVDSIEGYFVTYQNQDKKAGWLGRVKLAKLRVREAIHKVETPVLPRSSEKLSNTPSWSNASTGSTTTRTPGSSWCESKPPRGYLRDSTKGSRSIKSASDGSASWRT